MMEVYTLLAFDTAHDANPTMSLSPLALGSRGDSYGSPHRSARSSWRRSGHFYLSTTSGNVSLPESHVAASDSARSAPSPPGTRSDLSRRGSLRSSKMTPPGFCSSLGTRLNRGFGFVVASGGDIAPAEAERRRCVCAVDWTGPFASTAAGCSTSDQTSSSATSAWTTGSAARQSWALPRCLERPSRSPPSLHSLLSLACVCLDRGASRRAPTKPGRRYELEALGSCGSMCAFDISLVYCPIKILWQAKIVSWKLPHIRPSQTSTN